MSTTAVLFLNLACAAVAGVLAAKVLEGRVKRDHAGALGVVLHLGTAYLVNTTFWPPIYVAVGSGIAAAVLVSLAIRFAHRPRT